MKDVVNIFSAPPAHWVGDGFPVNTLFSYQSHGESVSPFLLLDYVAPTAFSPSEKVRGVGEHPHRGFETVTIAYQGQVAHKDSTDEQGLIGPGDVQWMTAASGILHEEFHSPAFSQRGGMLEMVQLWVNLPAKHKMDAPKYQLITAQQIPHIALDDEKGTMRLIAGEMAGLVGPASTHTAMLVLDGVIKAAGSVSLPILAGWTAIVVVRSGQLRINGRVLASGQTAFFSQAGSGIEFEALQDCELLVLGGEPIDEPVVGYGPFVMNSKDEIKKAIADFQMGKFGYLTTD